MLNVYLESGGNGKRRIMEVCSPVSGKQLMETLQRTVGVHSDSFFFKSNGRLVEENDVIFNGEVSLELKLCGGKGGFGSMLRAIGAQIEKTTNREACRDLSGRRLRDINEEKRLKSWIEKQSKRNEEAAERKKKKLERLRAEPKHEFKDKAYEKQRSELTSRVEEAVEVGFAAASVAAKRSIDEQAKSNPKKKLKTILDLDDDIDSDDLDSSDDSEVEQETKDKKESSNSSQSDDTSQSSSNQSEVNSNQSEVNSNQSEVNSNQSEVNSHQSEVNSKSDKQN